MDYKDLLKMAESATSLDDLIADLEKINKISDEVTKAKQRYLDFAEELADRCREYGSPRSVASVREVIRMRLVARDLWRIGVPLGKARSMTELEYAGAMNELESVLPRRIPCNSIR